MAAYDIFTSYYSTAGAREDILDLITNVSPSDTPFLSRLGTAKAGGTYHEWLTDTINSATGSGGAVLEGNSATNYDLSDKTRTWNYCQISDRTFAISGTQDAISKVGIDSEYSYQLEKAMKELKLFMEQILLNSVTATGSSAHARQLRGAFEFCESNIASGLSGASALTETAYNNLCQDIFAAGGNPDTTFVGGYLKRRMSAFATNATRTLNVETKGKIGGVVSMYESDFGVQDVVLDRWIPGGDGLVLQMDKWNVAYLRKPRTNPLAVDGDRRRVQILTEYTLECLNEKSGGELVSFVSA